MSVPEGWASSTLGKFFSDDELDHILSVFDSVDGDTMQAMDILKPWFNEPERAARLEANGLVASYASYAVPFLLGQNYVQVKQAQSRQQGGNPLWN